MFSISSGGGGLGTLLFYHYRPGPLNLGLAKVLLYHLLPVVSPEHAPLSGPGQGPRGLTRHGDGVLIGWGAGLPLPSGSWGQEAVANPLDHRGARGGGYHIEVGADQAEGHSVTKWSKGWARTGSSNGRRREWLDVLRMCGTVTRREGGSRCGGHIDW